MKGGASKSGLSKSRKSRRGPSRSRFTKTRYIRRTNATNEEKNAISAAQREFAAASEEATRISKLPPTEDTAKQIDAIVERLTVAANKLEALLDERRLVAAMGSMGL